MTPRIVRLTLVALVVGALIRPLAAQFVVYDPTNYAEAVVEVEQLIRQYEFLLAQAKRVPVDIETRYHGYSLDWTFHDPASLLYAAALTTALNEGDVSGTAYRRVSDPLDIPSDAWTRMPADMQRRLTDSYSTIELQDSANRLAIDQTGLARSEGPLMLQNIRNVEHDIDNPGDDFHSETALLEKINAAAAMQLRVGEQSNQFLLSTLEQQVIDAKRKRDAETRVMNATIYQWRYGQAYGADLFRNTADDLDGWRPY
jgi:hypothetical protein